MLKTMLYILFSILQYILYVKFSPMQYHKILNYMSSFMLNIFENRCSSISRHSPFFLMPFVLLSMVAFNMRTIKI